MKTIICNDFSLHMLNGNLTIRIKKIPITEFKNILKNKEFVSRIGSKKIARDFDLKYNKSNIILNEDVELYVIKPINGDLSENIEYEFFHIAYVTGD